MFLTDVSAGSLWRVREDVWKDNLRVSNYTSDRKWHPGLSILAEKNKQNDNEETVPVLFGTSGKRGMILVRGISNDKKYGKTHTCVFGKIIAPIALSKKKLWEQEIKYGLFHGHLNDDPWFEEFEVIPNREKPRLDSGEQEQLEKFLKEKMAEDE